MEAKDLLDKILQDKKKKQEDLDNQLVIKSEDNELLERVDKKLITEDGRQLLRD